MHTLSYGFDTSFAWSVGSDIGPFCEVSFTPLQIASLYRHVSVVKVLKGILESTTEYESGVTALQIATEMRRDEIVNILTGLPEVKMDLKRLERERQTHENAANTILVVAALIGGVTFAAGLQPPLLYSPFYGTANLDVGAPIPPGMYPSFASVEDHPLMPLFCIVNSLSFFSSIAALIVGAAAARPRRTDKYIGVRVRYLRNLLNFAYQLVYYSQVFFLLAFILAFKLLYPPIQIYSRIYFAIFFVMMVVISIYGFLFCYFSREYQKK